MTTNYDYKTLWKILAKDKAIESHHVVQYCLTKAIKAKGENKKEIYEALLKRAFTPKNNGSWQGLNDAVRRARGGWYGSKLFGQISLENFFTEEELKLYKEIINEQVSVKDDNQYTYIFVRQDLAPEYQLVQAAHVTCVLGAHLDKTVVKPVNPANLYFVVVGVKDLEALDKVCEYLSKQDHRFVDFVEPDIGDERTAIATMPVRGDARKDFRKFKKLKF